MANRSVFPNGIDQFREHFEMQASDIPNIQRYQSLLLKHNRTASEEDELVNLKLLLADKIIGSEDFNKLEDCIIALEEYFLNDVVPYLDSLEVGALRTDVGVPINLTTTNKTNLVEAVNEVNGKSYSKSETDTKYVPYNGASTNIDLNGKSIMNGLKEVIKPSTHGIPSFPNQSYVYVRKTSATSVASGVNTKVSFDTEITDNQSEFATSEFIPKVSGYYYVDFQCIWASAPSGDINHLLYENGVSFSSNYGGSASKITSISRVFNFIAGRSYTFYVSHINGGTAINLNQTNVHIHKLS